MTLDDLARAFAKAHPTHNGGTWHLWCGALMYQMTAAYGVTPNPIPASAKLAGDAVGKLNPIAKLAPAGAFHYWTWGTDGHVGLDTTGGGTNVFMASSLLRESLGDGIGFQSVVKYPHPYRGWAMFYGKKGTINVPVPPPTIFDVRTWNGAQGIIGSAIDGNTPVTYDVLRWTIYKLEHRKV